MTPAQVKAIRDEIVLVRGDLAAMRLRIALNTPIPQAYLFQGHACAAPPNGTFEVGRHPLRLDGVALSWPLPSNSDGAL